MDEQIAVLTDTNSGITPEQAARYENFTACASPKKLLDEYGNCVERSEDCEDHCEYNFSGKFCVEGTEIALWAINTYKEALQTLTKVAS